MPEKPPRLPALSPEGSSSSPSSPSSASPEQWLEPAILRVAQAVEAQTATGFAIRDMVARALAVSAESDQRSELQLAEIKDALDRFGAGLEEVPRSLQALIAPLVDGQRTLGDGVEGVKGEVAGVKAEVKVVREISQEFATQPRELDAETPRHLQIFVLWITRVGWKHRLRIGLAVLGAATPWLSRWREIYQGIKLLLTGGI